MNKTFSLSILSLLCVVFVSCTNQDVINEQSEVQVIASLANTRTTYQENGDVIHTLWESGDAIGLSTSGQNNLKYTANSAGTSTIFNTTNTTLDNVDKTKVYAYYPYSDASNNMEAALPDLSTQYYAEGKSNVDFIYTDGTISASSLRLENFKHLFTFLKVTLPLDLLPVVDNYQTLRIWSESAYASITNGTFNLENGQMSTAGTKGNGIYYKIPTSNLPQGATQVTCYVAMLPQPGNAEIIFKAYKNAYNSTTILTKKTPAEGLQAGHVYDVSFAPEESYEDGDVVVLSRATKGSVNLIFMGDGFTQKDLGVGGYYEESIRKGVEYFFNIEPYKSYRDYFNVYMVVAESPKEGIPVGEASANQTKFGTYFRAETGTIIECDRNLVISYVGKTGVPTDKEFTSIVVLNSTRYAGSNTTDGYNRSVALCPMTVSENKSLETAIHHEAGGHGFGLLLDEYVGPDKLTEVDKLVIKEYQKVGRYLNVDFTDDTSQILWKDFIGLEKYKGVGAYEGATYPTGIWRCESTSCMRNSSIAYYNVQSRWAIVSRIMRLSGKEFTMQDFIASDNVTPPY